MNENGSKAYKYQVRKEEVSSYSNDVTHFK